MAKTLLTIVGALLVTVVSLLFLRKDLSKSEEGTSSSPFSFFSQSDSSGKKILSIGEKNYQVEVVDTPEKREKGLSGTDQVPEQGMLFVFDQKDIQHFWMKDMKYDLDFIWMADDKVIDITENVPHPGPETVLADLPVYSPKQPASMMLEVPAGFVKQEEIHVGDVVRLK